MYSIRVDGHFSSAHNLRGYKGKCEELHGHNWRVEVVAASDKLDKLGVVMDFTVIKTHLHEVIEKLDHKYLNEIPYFLKFNPTSENIAKYI
jgi:6-pyruvoyltetrahydropterin/6-carboxytetrahydropterin synthase